MTNESVPESSEHDDPHAESEFQRIFTQYVDELNVNAFVDPDQILQDHPELGPAILEDLETYIQLRPHEAVNEPLGTLGDYTLRRQIGRGGMGVVYEAWQGSLDRQVALKVLPAGIAADTRATSRFLREAQVAAKLNHPQVVSVYGFGVEQNSPYYAMLTGQSPRTSLRS